MIRRNYLLLACILFLLPGITGVTLGEEISEENYRLGIRPAPQFVLALVPADAKVYTPVITRGAPLEVAVYMQPKND